MSFRGLLFGRNLIKYSTNCLYQRYTSFGLLKRAKIFGDFKIPVSTGHPSSQNDVKDCLIYEGQLKTQMLLVKVFSLTTSACGLILQPFALSKVLETNLYLTIGFGAISTFIIVGTPLLLHWLTKRYVTQLLFNPVKKTFTATTVSLFLREKRTIFTADDVIIPDINIFFTSFFVKKTPLFVDSNSVTDIDAYKHLLGYDKPIDFHFGNQQKQDKIKE